VQVHLQWNEYSNKNQKYTNVHHCLKLNGIMNQARKKVRALLGIHKTPECWWALLEIHKTPEC